MSFESVQKFRAGCAENDAKRDAGLTTPEDITRFDDIIYGNYGKETSLDVYCPRGTAAPLPTILSVHGGGWVYGDKELYSHYCMRLAQRGFTVVNFTYRLAPENRYPAVLEDCCAVFTWVAAHAEEYFIDLRNLFMVGDSAGGQLVYQLCTILTNPAYKALFKLDIPEGFRINACGLNCGCYFMPVSRVTPPAGMLADYLPENWKPYVKQLQTKKYVTADFPPSYVMSSEADFLKVMAKPMYRLLRNRGVEAELHIFGSKDRKDIGHVFHVNCYLPEAAQCNDEECAFFRRHLR